MRAAVAAELALAVQALVRAVRVVRAAAARAAPKMLLGLMLPLLIPVVAAVVAADNHLQLAGMALMEPSFYLCRQRTILVSLLDRRP